MWHEDIDNSIKVAIMKDYAEGLYFVLLCASEGDPRGFSNEKKDCRDFASLILPLKMALERYEKEEFPITEETAK